MISLQKKEKGFTIVELLIVIVVIGILAALVIVTFSGIQRKARDSERTTDIGAVNSQLEAYHAQEGFYPTLANLQDNGWVTDNLKGLDVESLRDPKGAAGNNIVGTRTANAYSYAVLPDGCTNADAATECQSYVLTAVPEEDGADDIVKNSLN